MELGGTVQAIAADLGTVAEVDELYGAANGRALGALLPITGRGLGKAFLDQPWGDVRHAIDTYVTGMVYLLDTVGNEMRTRRSGRIFITGPDRVARQVLLNR